MEPQDPAFNGKVSDAQLRLLVQAARPGFFSRDVSEFAPLRSLGLVYINVLTNEVGLTPLGRNWLESQDLLPPSTG